MSDERERIVRELERHGARRGEGLQRAERELAAIANLLPAALAVGLTKMDIHRLSGVGRPTIDALLRDKTK